METLLDKLLDPGRLVAPVAVTIIMVAAMILWALGRRRMLKDTLLQSVHELVHAGGETDVYFYADIFLGEPSNVRKVGSWLARAIQKAQHEGGRIHRLGFIEKTEGPVGAITLKDLSTWLTNIAAVTVRLADEIPSPFLKIKGKQAEDAEGINVLRKGERVVVVNDVATSGRTVMDAVKILREAGARVDLVLTLFDQEEGAAAKLEQENIKLISYLTYSELRSKTEDRRRYEKEKGSGSATAPAGV